MSADEKAIREIIASTDSGKPAENTADMVLFNSTVERPWYRDQGKPAVRKPGTEERIPGSSRRTSKITRLEIAKSGDMAYVVDEGSVTTRLKNGQTETSSDAMLRVFKKENNRWLTTAAFVMPISQATKQDR
jgi:ketosteroid isomerase-like protein